MFVCICNGYRDSEISEAARSGATCARDAYECLGNGPVCGRCLDLAQNLIDQCHGANSNVPAMMEAAE